MLYLDTSLLVALLTAEADGERIEAWLHSEDDEDLAVSDWVITEFSAALSIKLRTGQIDATRRVAVLSAFTRFCANHATVLTIERDQFRTAAHFSDQYARGLKGGDALHLAICFKHGARLCTLDQQLSVAGPALGVGTTLV
jgi:predicted nucleic acid-binding protein